MKKNYRQAARTCSNCKHHVVTWEHDSSDDFWCARGAPTRPPCGSVGMHESCFDGIPDGTSQEGLTEIVESRRTAWEKWSRKRRISATGVCDEWEATPKKRNRERAFP